MHTKTKRGILLIWLTTSALLFQSGVRANAQAQAPDAAPRNQIKPAETQGQYTVIRDHVNGLERITGKVKVLNAHTLAFDDGTEVELNGGMDAPE